jgi:hypothetical protein
VRNGGIATLKPRHTCAGISLRLRKAWSAFFSDKLLADPKYAHTGDLFPGNRRRIHGAPIDGAPFGRLIMSERVDRCPLRHSMGVFDSMLNGVPR